MRGVGENATRRKEQIDALYGSISTSIPELCENFRTWITLPRGIPYSVRLIITRPAFFQLLASQPCGLGCNREPLPRDICSIYSIIYKLRQAATEIDQVFCLNEYHLTETELSEFLVKKIKVHKQSIYEF